MRALARALTWEDGALAALAALWALSGARMESFHAVTVLAAVFVLSVGLERGLAAALARATAVAALGLGAARLHPGHAMGLELAATGACAVAAGALGAAQRRSRLALERSFRETLEALARALEARDVYTEGHSRRTAAYAAAVADAMGLPADERSAIERAGLLHDLGKIGVRDAVLLKEGSLTPEEEGQMRLHPELGGRILAGISFLRDASALARHHHERFDGKGYPDGLAGEAIPLGARILAVADALDAMTTDRPYRRALSGDEAVARLRQGAGSQFDPDVVAALERAGVARMS